MAKRKIETDRSQLLFDSIRTLINESKSAIAISVNRQLTLLYWNIGKTIKSDILHNKRAGYGEQVIETLSLKLTEEFGKGWTKQQLWNCLYTVETIPSKKIIYTLSGELSWSHIKELIYIKDDLQREFYMQLCKNEQWSVRQLRERKDSMLYERTALSKKPSKLIQKELKALQNRQPVSPDVFFRDPYLLDFLGLQDAFSEKDLESAIIAELQRFITELGNDFAFLARQKRISVDGEDYYIDLLFYHRQLHRLVAIDLKLGKFKTAYKAQMELYLKWLNKYEKKEHEESPIGLILCADKSQEHIELLELDKGNIRVAQYYTILPSKKLLQEKLHKVLLKAQQNVTSIHNNDR
ncbi:MAG: PDDEXK nuclease domain-containing protein [Chloroherpetonaceae bacterium]|nr:PDDEXK nuclease domain-containing protein [Chloroherpetonaceae bacterium]